MDAHYGSSMRDRTRLGKSPVRARRNDASLPNPCLYWQYGDSQRPRRTHMAGLQAGLTAHTLRIDLVDSWDK